MNRIEWTKKALRDLKGIDKTRRIAVLDGVKKLKNFDGQRLEKVKALYRHEYQYRLRVGNIRVMFNYDEKIEIVQIEKVAKRNERTY